DILNSSEGLTVVGQAANGSEAIEAVRAHYPDVVFMDLHMPVMDGHQATAHIRALHSPPAVGILTSLNVDETCLRALQARACSFVVKASPNADVIRAAHTATSEEPFYSPAAAAAMRAALPHHPQENASFSSLTPRAQQVAELLRHGCS